MKQVKKSIFPSLVPPSPELKEKIKKQLEELQGTLSPSILSSSIIFRRNKPLGLDDGLIYPPGTFPLDLSPPETDHSHEDVSAAPIKGLIRVVVVLVDFPDQEMTTSRGHYEELFFSEKVLPHGSVKEYFKDVSNSIVDIEGEVVGPYRLDHNISYYANGESGTPPRTDPNMFPNAGVMAYDALLAANSDVDFSLYDNDSDGFVDAYIVVHAGRGAEVTGDKNDIWSHKWVLDKGRTNSNKTSHTADAVNIFAYLTIPEDARIGVCCHEIAHLIFRLPDLYDTDGSSAGIGNWCLMAGGTWGGGGNKPTHPSAWCKLNQEWVNVINVNTDQRLRIEDVKDSNTIYRLWKDGVVGKEYFLIENRQQNGYDEHIPGEGLLIWHIDENVATNSNEVHYKVALMQADNNRDLERDVNRGDQGDVYPGTSNNKTFDNISSPNSSSYSGANSCVSISKISQRNGVIEADVSVSCFQGWEKIASGTKQDLYTLHFPSAKFGYCAGARGTVRKTTNGGLKWVTKSKGIPTTAYIYSIFFTTNNVGYAVGNSGNAFKTTNGGTSWTRFKVTNSHLRNVFFTTSRTGYISADGAIFETTNAGKTWNNITNRLPKGTSAREIGSSEIYFINKNTGFLLLQSKILKTMNGADSWKSISVPGLALYDVDFINNTTGFICGIGTGLIRTTNQGETWQKVITYRSNTPMTVHFANSRNGIVAGRFGKIHATTNGGLSWRTEVSNTNADLHKVLFNTHSGSYIAVGKKGTIIRKSMPII